jgi:hypothetical protein
MQQVKAQSARQTSEQRGVVLVAEDELGPHESLRMMQPSEYEVLTTDGATASLEVRNATDFAAWKPRAPESTATSATSSSNALTSFKLKPQVVGVHCEIAPISERTEPPSEALNTEVFGNRFDQNINGELAR